MDEPNPTPFRLLELISGVKVTKVLATMHELGIFEQLRDGQARTVAQIAAEHQLAHRPVEMLLIACNALGLLERTEDGYRNTSIAGEFLVAGKPYYLGDYLAMIDRRGFAAWARLTAAVRHNRPTAWDATARTSPFDGEDPLLVQTFWKAMNALSSYTAAQLGATVDLSSTRRLLDVGGGGGAFAIELSRRYPQLHTTIYDLPFVCDLTGTRLKQADLTSRVSLVRGDFFRDRALPSGHDTCLLSMILHDWGEQENLTILRKVHTALDRSGRVLIAEQFLDADRTGPLGAALMNLSMLVETVDGRNYPKEDYVRWLRAVGFAPPRFVPFAGLSANGVLIAAKH